MGAKVSTLGSDAVDVFFVPDRSGDQLTDDHAAAKLDKLYVHPAHQRRGYGRLLIERAVAAARRAIRFLIIDEFDGEEA